MRRAQRKQREANRSVFARHSAHLGRRTAAEEQTHTHPPPCSPHPSHTSSDLVVLTHTHAVLREELHACWWHEWVCVCWCQGVGQCRLGPKQTPVKPPAHGERQAGRTAEMRGGRWGKGKQRRGRKREKKEEKGDWRRRIRQLFTAISGGQPQSELRSLSASGGTIQFTFHLCHVPLSLTCNTTSA